MNIFKLYSYEMKKNKKLFIIMFVVSILNLLYLLYSTMADDIGAMSVKGAMIKKMVDVGLLPFKVDGLQLFNDNFFSLSVIDNATSTSSILSMGLVLLSIVLSLRIVTSDYARRNKSFMIQNFLPVKIYEIKVAKILTGLSLYIFTIILTYLSVIVRNIVLKFSTGRFINFNILDIDRVMSVNLFIPIGLKSTLVMLFLFTLTCVIGVQSLSSIFLTKQDKNKKAVNTLYLIITVFLGFVLMASYLLLVTLEAVFEGVIPSVINFNILTIYHTIFVILSAVLFTIDLVITKKRLRGGI